MDSAPTRYAVFPGTIGLAVLLLKMFGKDSVDVGNWLTPCYVIGASEQDLQAACDLANESWLKHYPTEPVSFCKVG